MFKWFTQERKDLEKKDIKKKDIKDYEIEELKYSYRQMGKYVSSFNIPELADIELRIANELLDIEVKKKWFAERYGNK